MYGKLEGCAADAGSMHLLTGRSRLWNAIVGNHIHWRSGWPGGKMQRDGHLLLFREGAAEGEFHELDLAALCKYLCCLCARTTCIAWGQQ
jgi:hypothetical protein